MERPGGGRAGEAPCGTAAGAEGGVVDGRWVLISADCGTCAVLGATDDAFALLMVAGVVSATVTSVSFSGANGPNPKSNASSSPSPVSQCPIFNTLLGLTPGVLEDGTADTIGGAGETGLGNEIGSGEIGSDDIGSNEFGDEIGSDGIGSGSSSGSGKEVAGEGCEMST